MKLGKKFIIKAMKQEIIKIFTTGGTIDKVYFDAKSTYTIGKPAVKTILDELPLAIKYDIRSLMKKDSLDMQQKDRELVLAEVKKTRARRILITHGTDTMADTAKTLSQIKNKTIVITGAMQPALFKISDAVFNIGCAVSAVQSLAPGVYITMSGKIFTYDNVIKDRAAGRFKTLSD